MRRAESSSPIPAILAIAFLAGCRGAEQPHILLVSVDTLRADHMSLYGYERPTTPAIDRFFADGEIYERAYSADANTSPSMTTVLTGLYPARHGIRLFYQRIEDDLRLLPDYLRRHGYATAAVVSNLVLTGEAIGFDARFDHYDDFVDERELNRRVFQRRASRTTDAAIRWLDQVRSPGRPHLLWVHYIDPHGPYAPPPDRPTDFTHEGELPLDPRRLSNAQRLDGVRDALEYVDRYDEEIAYADREIGRLLQRYEELGLAERAIIVLTADHGETMTDYDRLFRHGYHVWEPIMRVPLAIRRPGGPKLRVDSPVSLADLLPTLLGWAGIAVPEGLDGRPLAQRNPTAPLSLEARDRDVKHRAMIRGSEKWFLTTDEEGAVIARSYVDLRQGDERVAAPGWPDGEEPALVRWLREDPDPGGLPEEYLEGRRRASPKVAPERTDEQLEALRALGYID